MDLETIWPYVLGLMVLLAVRREVVLTSGWGHRAQSAVWLGIVAIGMVAAYVVGHGLISLGGVELFATILGLGSFRAWLWTKELDGGFGVELSVAFGAQGMRLRGNEIGHC
ncbi:MAG: hypothetical protein AAF709_21860 [Pseudomonadota bacterium]